MLFAWGQKKKTKKNMTAIFHSTALVTALACAAERTFNLFFPSSLGECFIFLDKIDICKIMRIPFKLHPSMDNCKDMITYHRSVKIVS